MAEEEGVDPREFGIRVMFFSGEPGASIPGIREHIARTFGARVVDSGTMAEVDPLDARRRQRRDRRHAAVAGHCLHRGL
ncbi:MAG: hypothetical protein U5L11_16080 [Arhodomonas sp.]|nr:hypothetical protein [Arhodomonas sp.]